MKNTMIDNDTERLLQGPLRELEEARLALATAAIAARADRSIARESLEKAQDLGAEVFRVRDQLKLARLDADESYARVLDLEMEVRQQQARLADLHGQNERLGEHLRQALALHHEDGVRWQSEVARLLEAHQHDTTVWQAEVARVLAAHQHDSATRQAEVERLHLLHRDDKARWQEAHQHDSATRQAEVERLHILYRDDKARWQAELDRVHADADETARVLGEVLASRSWRMTRGIRRVIEHFRGREWAEPKAPAAARGTSAALPRATPGPHGDD